MEIIVFKNGHSYLQDITFKNGVETTSIPHAKWFKSEEEAKRYKKENNLKKEYKVHKITVKGV